MQSIDRSLLIRRLVRSAGLQALWNVYDRGMPVFVHTIDVVDLCLDRLAHSPEINATVVVIAGLIHDLSKDTSTRDDGRSHSLLMRTDPRAAAEPSMALLSEIEQSTQVYLSTIERAHVHHCVMTHHGLHGKLAPETQEAWLIAEFDEISGTRHRLAPIDANNILPLLAQGYKWPEAAISLGVTRDLIKTRLRDATLAEGVRDWIDLMPIWQANGSVRGGTPERQANLARAKHAVQIAQASPEYLIERLDSITVVAN